MNRANCQFQLQVTGFSMTGPSTGIYRKKHFTQTAEFCFSNFVLIAS